MASTIPPWTNDATGLDNGHFDTSKTGWTVVSQAGTYNLTWQESGYSFSGGPQPSNYGNGFAVFGLSVSHPTTPRGYIYARVQFLTSELNRPVNLSFLVWNNQTDASISFTVKVGSSHGNGEYLESGPHTGSNTNQVDVPFTPTENISFVTIAHTSTDGAAGTSDYIGVDRIIINERPLALNTGSITTWTGPPPASLTSWSSEALVTGTSWS